MEDTDLHPSAPVAEADEAANSVGVADEIELEPSASNTTDGSSVIVMPTTIEEQLSQLYQRQDEQMHLVSELRSRVLELEGFVQKLMNGSSNSGNNCTTGAAVDRKRSNGEANPPPLPTTSTLSHHSDQASSSQLVDSSVAIANDNTITPATTTTTTTTSTDDEITTILHNRQTQKAWPLKRKYCSSFSQEIELMKLRFHNSTLYPHKTVRIPKHLPHQSQSSSVPSSSSTAAAAAEEEALTSSSGLMEALTSSEETARSTTTAMETITTSTSHSQSDGGNDEAVTAACSSSSSSSNNNSGSFGNLGNKEGRLICRLCSGKNMNRNTSWMCNTCIVPLCIDIIDGNNPQSSCFAKWHTCIDLVRENQILNGELREKRTMKKQRVSTTGGSGSGDGGGGS